MKTFPGIPIDVQFASGELLGQQAVHKLKMTRGQVRCILTVATYAQDTPEQIQLRADAWTARLRGLFRGNRDVPRVVHNP